MQTVFSGFTYVLAVAMNTRLYDLKDASWGVFVSEGSAKFRNIRISSL